jgi:hypothetical protein
MPFIGLPDPAHRVLKLYGQEINLFKFGRMPAQVLINKAGVAKFVHYGDAMSDIPRNAEILKLIDELNKSSTIVMTPAPATAAITSGPETELQRRRWYALAIMSIGSFMTPFDASIVAVALPSMGADLHLSYSQGLWAQAAYLLVASILLIPLGRLADSRGPVRYNLLGTAIFALGSIVAALAPSGTIMIIGRCIQGAGGAFMFSTSSGIITAAFPAAERGRALGLNVTPSTLV